MGVLFILMCIGYLSNKAGWMNATFNKQLSTFVVNAAVPAMILSSVMDDERLLTNSEMLILLSIAVLSFIFMIFVSMLFPKLLRCQANDAPLIRFLLIFSNTGFMGFPVVAAIFGSNAVFYAALFNIPFNVFCFSYGIKLISNGSAGGFSFKTLASPAIIAAILSIFIYLVNIPIPKIISMPLEYMSDMTIPCAMCIIGSSLAMAPLKELFSGFRIYLLAAIKLLIIPSLFFAIMYFIPVSDICKQVTVVMWMLPSATNTTMLATIYDGNEFMASKGVFVTTVLSCITIPFLCWLFFIH